MAPTSDEHHAHAGDDPRTLVLRDGDVPATGDLHSQVQAASRPPRISISLPAGLGPMQRILIRAIQFYQRRISRRIGATCAYEPSCSDYGLLAIAYQGTVRGSTATLARLARCLPKHQGTVDYPKGVPDVPDRQHRP